MIKSFPKIFSIGQDYIKDIFDTEVEITEKIDGCVCLDEKILKSDFKYVLAKNIKKGDKLIGFKENLNNSTLLETEVLTAKIIQKNCYLITLKDGRTIKASEDHPWVVRFSKKVNTNYGKWLSKNYIETSKLKKGMKILDISYWEEDNTYEGGYIAGQFDGEGSLVGNCKNHNATHLTYCQKEGDGAEILNKYLVKKGFKTNLSYRKRKKEWKNIASIRILGGWTECLRFIGVFKPQRLLKKTFDKLINNRRMHGIKDVEVKEIKFIGKQKVMGLSTSSKTYIVKGLLCHNSQFCFGKINGELFCRSKGQQLFFENPEAMFKKAVDYVLEIQDKIPDDMIYYCEYLKTSRHNILHYGRIPKNNLILFGVSDNTERFISTYEVLKGFAELIDIECVPLIYSGKINNSDEILNFLERESILSGVNIEGVVVKNYNKPFLLGGQPIPIMMGKFVSEKFKETHREKWGKEFTNKGRWETFKESFRTEARWEKAIQHLKEKGELTNSPKDIGGLIKMIQEDITEEEKEDIKKFLWQEFGKDILRYSTGGFPEYYKNLLLNKQFNKQNE